MRTLAAITLRSLAWRRWGSVSILVTAVVAVAAATLGPLWANAAEDSLVTEQLREATPATRAVSVFSESNVPVFGQVVIPHVALTTAQRASRLPPSVAQHMSGGQSALTSTQRLGIRFGKTLGLGQLQWVDGGCKRLVLVTGRCPTKDTEVVMSARSADVLGTERRSVITIPELSREPPVAGEGSPFPTAFRVVGIYRPAPSDDPFWAASKAFDFAPAVTARSSPRPGRLDALLATQSLLTRLGTTPVTARHTQLVDMRTTNAEHVDAFEAGLAQWLDEQTPQRRSDDVTVDAPTLTLLAELHPVRDAIRLASYLLGLQLLILVCYVLYLIVGSSADARSHDVALAKLRGLPRRTIALFALAEPLLLLVLALPIGVALGFVVTDAVADRWLPGETALRPDGRLTTAVVVAFAVAWAAAAFGLSQLLRRAVLDQLRRVVPGTSARRLLPAEIVVVTLAVAAVVELQSRSGDGSLVGLTLLAPGLAAVAAGVIGARVVRVAVLPWAWRTRARASVASFLAARQIGRRDGAARTALVVTVAVSLATFAGATWTIAADQRAARAAMEVGAPTVYTVDTAVATQLLETVRRLDPAGDRLAAAVEYAPEETPREQWVVAVDSERLPTVATWRDEWAVESVHEVSAALRPRLAPSVEFAGREISLDVDARMSSRSPDVVLTAGLSLADGTPRRVPLGRVAFGPQTLTVKADLCAAGCTLTDLTLVRLPGEIGALVGSATLRSLRVDGAPLAEVFAQGDHWRSTRVDEARTDSSAVTTFDVTADGLVMAFNASPSAVPGVVRDDVPESLPVVLAGDTPADSFGRGLVFARSLSGVTTLGEITARAAALPRLGRVGTLADLELAYRLTPEIDTRATFQVWAAAGAGDGVADELSDAGLSVLDRETVSERADALGHSGSALALFLLVGVAVVALAVAALSVLAFALLQARRRSYELAALRTVGVRDGALRAASAREHGLLIGLGAVLGLASGAWTARLLGPEVGELGQTGELAPVVPGVSWGTLGITATATLVLFGLVVFACSRMSLRFATPDLLRGVQT